MTQRGQILLNSYQLLLLLGVLGGVFACKGENVESKASGYPADIAPIMLQSCAVSGCHNAQSAAAAGGLNLTSWSSLFEGSRGGSPVIPFEPELSYLLFSVNTDSTLGPTLSPTMPFNEAPLSSEEYASLWNWIYDGARNADGELRFPPNPNRRKWYVGHQICDEVAVFDAETRQIMHYIDVGSNSDDIEYVFDVKVTPDGKDWFVVYFGLNEFITRYSTLTDEKIADITMDYFAWSTIAFSPDSRFAFACGEFTSLLQVVDLEKNATVAPAMAFNYEVRGPTVHPLRQQVYLTEYQDRGLVVLDYDNNGLLDNQRSVDLIQGVPPSIPGDIWPFEIVFATDASKYFVSCSHSNEVRILDGKMDSLLAVVELPATPSKMAYSASAGRLFVSCMEDLVSWGGEPGKRGSIFVIDADSYQIERTVYSGFQPYAIMADEEKGVLMVANRNTDPTGPVPHHVAAYCEGRNGYVTLVDLHSLELIPQFKTEILGDPSTVAGM